MERTAGRAEPDASMKARLSRARRAAAALFLLNAVAYATIVPRLPAIKNALDLSNTALGAAVAAMPIGALVSGPAAGWGVKRFGSGRVAVACAVGFGCVLPLFALSANWAMLAGTFLLLGVLDSWMDVSMNANALEVQRRSGRSIINGLHGLWSVGAVVGGLAGSAAAGLGLSLALHFIGAGTAIVAVALVLPPRLLPDAPPSAADGDDEPDGRRFAALRALGVLGVIVVLASIVEDVPPTWAAILLREDLAAAAAVAGLGYVAFQASMTVGRLMADRAVDRWGAVAVVRVGTAITAIGATAGLAIGRPWSVLAGLAVAGLGAAPLYPLAFQAGSELPGVPSGYGVAAVAWLGRVGFFVAPPLVGATADAIGLRNAMFLMPAAAVGTFLLAARFRSREQ
jgi:MFS family permease